ncbi:MAG: hypothetical protein V4555_16440 [Acidobacteriota bacterium]
MNRSILGFHRDLKALSQALKKGEMEWFAETLEEAKIILLTMNNCESLTIGEEEELAVLVYRAVFRKPLTAPRCPELEQWLAICRKRGQRSE